MTKSNKKKVIVLLIIAVLLIVVPVIALPGATFGGSDDAGSVMVEEVTGQAYEPWYTPVLEQFLGGELPGELEPQEPVPVGICISLSDTVQPFPKTLHLVPRIVTAGIGCRKGVPKEQIRIRLEQALEQAGVSEKALCRIASIDLKAREPGILELCREYGIPFETFTAEELKAVPGAFTTSAFVKDTTGVDNVCERSAVLAGGRLIEKKHAGAGVTIALAAGEWRAKF